MKPAEFTASSAAYTPILYGKAAFSVRPDFEKNYVVSYQEETSLICNLGQCHFSDQSDKKGDVYRHLIVAFIFLSASLQWIIPHSEYNIYD